MRKTSLLVSVSGAFVVKTFQASPDLTLEILVVETSLDSVGSLNIDLPIL